MTEAEWLTSDNFPEILILLRDESTATGKEARTGLHSRTGFLVPGPSLRTTSGGRLRAFAMNCVPDWRELPLDPPSEELIDAYEAFLDQRQSRKAFVAACAVDLLLGKG